MEALHSRRTYDDRIQEAICESGDRDLFPDLNIPRSTIRSWIHRGPPDVISCDLAADDHAELVAQIERLRHRTALLGAVVALLIAVLRASKIQLEYERIPNGGAKRILLRAIDRTRKVLPLGAALRITRLSASRYHGWCRDEAGCDLESSRHPRRGIGWSKRKAGDVLEFGSIPPNPRSESEQRLPAKSFIWT